LVGVVGAVVEIPVLAVFHTGQDFAQGRAIAFALIRDDPNMANTDSVG
jgi:hypothetical protein